MQRNNSGIEMTGPAGRNAAAGGVKRSNVPVRCALRAANSDTVASAFPPDGAVRQSDVVDFSQTSRNAIITQRPA